MHTLTTRRSMIMCVVVVALSTVAVLGVDRLGRSSRVIGPHGAIQAQTIAKSEVDNPADAYRTWKSAGYRGRTIVYVSGGWESFDPGELVPVQMFRAYPLQLYNTARLIEDTRLTDITFLYVAALNKICRRIVAILPESEVSRMKGVARTSKDVRVSEQALFVSREGFPRWFTTVAGLECAGEPVLLYVGASYFKSAEPEELFHRLASCGLRTDCIVLCREKGKDSVSPREIDRLDRFARLIGINPTRITDSGVSRPGTDRSRTVAAS